MRLPALLLRNKKDVHKNVFGHVLIVAGSQQMLGAGALSALSAMRSGAGLVSLGIPKSLNTIAQKKVSNEVMTIALVETKDQSVSSTALQQLKKTFDKFSVLAIGPGLSLNKSTQRFVKECVLQSPIPLVIDADALNALAGHCEILLQTEMPKILTPHPGEMSRLLNISKKQLEDDCQKYALAFAKKYQCIVLLKGSQTIVASPEGKMYLNKTGNAGMAKAGSGDVLTGMIAAFVAQGLSPFDAAKYGAYLHGCAGDLAAAQMTRMGMIASDIIAMIPQAIKKSNS